MAQTRSATPYDAYVRLPQLRQTWPAEHEDAALVRFVCGFQAIELHLRLADQVLDDDRPAADSPRRLRAIVQQVVEGLEFVASGRTGTTRRPAGAEPPGPSAEAIRVLRRLPDKPARTLTALFEEFDWPELDYDAVVCPSEVLAQRDFPWQGPEDAMFRSAHQITECWLHIALREADEAVGRVRAQNWRAAAEHVAAAAEAVRLAICSNDLLELMVPADFHPLRVRLREGTAAHSTAAQRMMRLPARLVALLTEDGPSLLALMEDPELHLARYRYLRAVSELAKRCQTFLCHHYLLVLDMLGTDTRGTLGYAVRNLAERAMRPIVPELDQARHDVALFASLKHGSRSGTLSSSNEIAAGHHSLPTRPAPSECPETLVRNGIDRYFRAIGDRDVAAWVSLFEPNAGALFDISGTRPHIGAGKLKVFIGSTFEAFSEIRHTYVIESVDRGVADVSWEVNAVSHLGTPATFTGTEKFFFDADGLIIRAEAEWDPSDVARQIWPR